MSSSSGAVASSSSDHAYPLVRSFSSIDDWQRFFNDVKGTHQLVIIFFYAFWCGPSETMEVVILDLAYKYKDVAFVKIEVSELFTVATEYNIREVPLFVAVKQGKELERFVGAKADKLVAMVKKHHDAI